MNNRAENFKIENELIKKLELLKLERAGKKRTLQLHKLHKHYSYDDCTICIKLLAAISVLNADIEKISLVLCKFP